MTKCFDDLCITQPRPANPSFCLPSLQPDKRPRSPMTGDPLRAKDLLPLPLMADPDWKVIQEKGREGVQYKGDGRVTA